MNLESLFSLKGKIAVVTGGSRGVGAMIAEGFVSAGARVYISARDGDACELTARDLNRYPGECIAFPGDVSSITGIETLVAALTEREESVEILVNNAGTIWNERFDQFSVEGWDKVMNLNARSVFFMTQKMLPLLRSAARTDDPSRVINIASVLGARSNPMRAYSYCASKAALAQMTKNLAHDLAKENITVNGIAPGYFPSKMTSSIIEDAAANKAMLSKVRMGRQGKKEEIAGLVIYMASKSGAYLTGDIVYLDGGLILSS